MPSAEVMYARSTVHGYMQASAAVVLSWDYLLTLGDEITYFWSRKKTWLNTLFFMNRYLSLCAIVLSVKDLISRNARHPLDECMKARAFLNTTPIASHWSINTPNPCEIPTWSDDLWMLWIPLFSFEAVVLGLVARKAYRNVTYKCHSLARNWNESIKVISQDLTTSYCLYTLLICLASVVLWMFAPWMLVEIMDNYTLPVVSILATRMTIETRAKEGQNGIPLKANDPRKDNMIPQSPIEYPPDKVNNKIVY